MTTKAALRATQDTVGESPNTDLALIQTGSTNVMVDGRPMVKHGSQVAAHGAIPHLAPTMVATQQSNVLVDGVPACCLDDLAICGHVSLHGSTNVFIMI